MRLLHDWAKIHATFDDPNLVSQAGLLPVMALAQRAGLAALAGEHVRIARPCGVNPRVKVPCLVAGMIGGADSIDDLGLLRHGAMSVLFGGVRAPSTLGSFLRSFTWGNVLQLGQVNRLLLAELARRAPLLPGKDVLAFVDIDSQQKRVYGHHKQGAGFGHTKIQGKSLLVRGLNALAATISAIREAGDLTARAATLEGEVLQTQSLMEELLSTIYPRVSDAVALASIQVQPKATLEAHRDAGRALEQDIQSCRNRIQNAERDLLRQTRAYERLAQEEQAVSLQELQRLREHRRGEFSGRWRQRRRHPGESGQGALPRQGRRPQSRGERFRRDLIRRWPGGSARRCVSCTMPGWCRPTARAVSWYATSMSSRRSICSRCVCRSRSSRSRR